MRLVTSSCLLSAVAALFGSGAWAQSVISAHSGLVHYVEGRVLLDGQEIDPKFAQFPDMRNEAVLHTEQGRAEVLLSPGVFLRVGEDTTVKMLSNKLTDTRLELQAGRAMVECADAIKDNAVTLQVHGDSIRLLKNGLYEFSVQPATVRVYQGEVAVDSSAGQVTVRKGREAELAAVVEEHKFDTSRTDDLYNWASRRSGYLAQANVSAARTMSSGYNGYGLGTGLGSAYGLNMGYGIFGTPMFGPFGSYYGYTMGFGYGGFGYGGLGFGGLGMGGWAFNPLFGMYTYVPGEGVYMSPFGYPYWSPYTVGYALPSYYNGGTTGRVAGIAGRTHSSAPYQNSLMAARMRPATATARSTPGSGFGRSSAGYSGGRMSQSSVASAPSVSSMGSHGGGGGGGSRR